MAKQTFTTGQVLTAAQVTALQTNGYNQTVTTVTTNYTLLAADVGTRVYMNAAGATTITVNTGLFAAGDTLWLGNIGAGSCVVTSGTATVSKFSTASLTLSQYQGAYLYFTSTGVAILYSDAAGASIPLTTKGDLFGYDTANARIPIGTNNQVLTADSAQALGLKWATPTAASFVGCSVSNSANITVNTATYTALTWDTEQYDTDGIHSVASNTSRFTIPSGKAGKYLFTNVISWPGLDTPAGTVALYYYKNGTVVSNLTIRSYGITPAFSNAIVLDLAVADYIEFYARQTSGVSVTVLAGSGCQVSYLGA